MSVLFVCFWLVFLIGMVGMMFKRSYVISLLLCLEILMMSLFMILSCLGMFYGVSVSYYCMMILAVKACEASAGLALMVSLSRSHGKTLLSSLNLLYS